MPNFIQINSDKPAPPKTKQRAKEAAAAGDGRTAVGFGFNVFGYRCAKCGYYHSTTKGRKFKMYKGHRRGFGPGCASGGVCGPNDRQEK